MTTDCLIGKQLKMNFFRTTALCCLLALQGQAAICPSDLLQQAIDCTSSGNSCCSSVDTKAECPCSGGQTTPFSQGGEESCGGCQIDTHEHPSVWQIQTNDRLLPQPTSFCRILRLHAEPNALSYIPFAWMLEAPPGPKLRQAHCIWRL